LLLCRILGRVNATPLFFLVFKLFVADLIERNWSFNDPLTTVCLYFSHFNFLHGSIIRESNPFLVFNPYNLSLIC
jgi:hypothetical protein